MTASGQPSLNDKIDSLNEVDRFVLLMLAASEYKPIPGPLWLQKEMYLIQKAIPRLAEEIEYESYLMGPWSEMLQDEVEQLKSSNLLDIKDSKYALTPEGKEVAGALNKQADKKELAKVEDFKQFLNDLTKDELLAFTYFSHEHPEEIAKESMFFKEIQRKRKPLAISLYIKEKVSAQKAAQIAGMNIEDFIDELKKAVK